jgi:hypothetical protein
MAQSAPHWAARPSWSAGRTDAPCKSSGDYVDQQSCSGHPSHALGSLAEGVRSRDFHELQRSHQRSHWCLSISPARSAFHASDCKRHLFRGTRLTSAEHGQGSWDHGPKYLGSIRGKEPQGRAQKRGWGNDDGVAVRQSPAAALTFSVHAG